MFNNGNSANGGRVSNQWTVLVTTCTILVLNKPQPDLKVISGKIVLNYFSSHIEADLRPIQRVGNVCLGF